MATEEWFTQTFISTTAKLAWWCTTLILALERQRQAFQDSWIYRETLSQKDQKKKKVQQPIRV